MKKIRYYTIFIALILWPMLLHAQVSPGDVSNSLLMESAEAILGSTEINWKRVLINGKKKKQLKDKLESTTNIPDTLHIGSIKKDGEKFWVIPNIAPSKSEMFSYVLYLNEDKEIKDVDVLEYRESYGYEIDYSFFRKQFHGISDPKEIRFRRSIQNISGATISARSITYSVKDLLTIVQMVGVE